MIISQILSVALLSDPLDPSVSILGILTATDEKGPCCWSLNHRCRMLAPNNPAWQETTTYKYGGF